MCPRPSATRARQHPRGRNGRRALEPLPALREEAPLGPEPEERARELDALFAERR